MSLALRIWLALACAVPIVIVWALIIALVSRFRWKVSQWFLPMFAGPFVFVFIVVVVDIFCGAPFEFQNARAILFILGTTDLGSATGVTVIVGAVLTHLAATIVLSYCGLWRTQGMAPAARQWSLKRLSLWLLGSLGCVLLTLMLQSWIVCGVARQTIQQVVADAKGWRMPPGASAEPQDATQPPQYIAILDEVSTSKNPAFQISHSPYKPLSQALIRKAIEDANKISRVYVEAAEAMLRKTPFRPANNDLLTWDRHELTGFGKILNAARLATIIAIEERDHERAIRYLNTLALCSDQLRVYSDAECLIVSSEFADTRSALLERWLFESTPASPLVARIEPLKGTAFASHRESMVRRLEGILLYEHAHMLISSKPQNKNDPRMRVIQRASQSATDSTRFLDRVFLGADNLLLTPAPFEKNRHRFLVPASEFDGFGYGMPEEKRVGLTKLALSAYPTFSVACCRLWIEDARELINKTALQVEQYRQAEKKYPESLAQLVPMYLAQVPIDPFDSQPLRYLREGEGGAMVYSVGADHLDHQTGEPKFQGDRTFRDILFCLGSCYPSRRIPKPDER